MKLEFNISSGWNRIFISSGSKGNALPIKTIVILNAVKDLFKDCSTVKQIPHYVSEWQGDLGILHSYFLWAVRAVAAVPTPRIGMTEFFVHSTFLFFMGSADWSRSALCDLYAFANFSFLILNCYAALALRLDWIMLGLSALNAAVLPTYTLLSIIVCAEQEIRNSEDIIAFISAHQHNQRAIKNSISTF